jgi:hypothetical protein
MSWSPGGSQSDIGKSSASSWHCWLVWLVGEGRGDERNEQLVEAHLLLKRTVGRRPDGVRADCLATNTEYCDRCTHAATQATNVARIKTEGTKGLLQGQVAGLESGWIKLACRRPIKSCG